MKGTVSKILIAEDDKFLSNAYRVKLEKEGFETKLVGSGYELLDALKVYSPDLIILDLVMPNKDGFESLKEIKQNQEWKKIPIIIVSNLGQKGDVDQGIRLGAAGYFVKTDSQFKLANLVEEIKRLTSAG